MRSFLVILCILIPSYSYSDIRNCVEESYFNNPGGSVTVFIDPINCIEKCELKTNSLCRDITHLKGVDWDTYKIVGNKLQQDIVLKQAKEARKQQEAGRLNRLKELANKAALTPTERDEVLLELLKQYK